MNDDFLKDNDLRIVVGTKGRVNKQLTIKNLWAIPHLIDLICHPDDYDGLYELYNGKVRSISVYPIELDNNLGEQRQWIVEQTSEKYLLLMDDNLSFNTRSPSMTGNETKFPLKGMIEKHFPQEKMYEEQINLLNTVMEKIKEPDVGVVGLSQRSGNNRVEGRYKENTRIFAFSLIDISLMKEHGIKFNDVNLKQDFYVNLSFLTRGYKNVCVYDYAFDKPSANMVGGCSTYRTPEKSNEAARILQSKFPDFVSIRKKSTKSWDGFEDTAEDVMIKWQKAYDYGVNRNNQMEEW